LLPTQADHFEQDFELFWRRASERRIKKSRARVEHADQKHKTQTNNRKRVRFVFVLEYDYWDEFDELGKMKMLKCVFVFVVRTVAVNFGYLVVGTRVRQLPVANIG
jgi:hypothetical protein